MRTGKKQKLKFLKMLIISSCPTVSNYLIGETRNLAYRGIASARFTRVCFPAANPDYERLLCAADSTGRSKVNFYMLSSLHLRRLLFVGTSNPY